MKLAGNLPRKLAFYAPLKPLGHPVASGDLMIARDLFQYFQNYGFQCSELSQFQAKQFWLSPKKIILAGIELVRIFVSLIRNPPDVFFTYHVYCKCPDLLAPLFSFLFRKPYIIYEASCTPKARRYWKTLPGYWLTRWALSRATIIISNMSEDYEDLLALFGEEPKEQKLSAKIREKKLYYSPPAIDLRQFRRNDSLAKNICGKYQFTQGCVRILCVAMLRDGCKAQSVEFLLRSLEIVKNKGIENFELVVVGEGSKRKELEKLANKILPGKVLFLGAQPRSELVGIYSACDFFAFPGIDESFGMVYIEAQACGLPVVAVSNAGVPEAVAHKKSGWLTDFSIGAYAEALEVFIVKGETRQEFQRNATEYVEARHNRERNYASVVELIISSASPKNSERIQEVSRHEKSEA